MTQTATPAQTLPAMWTEPRRDKYGRPFVHLMATVVKDGDDKARWQTCVVVTTMPKTWTEARPTERYMVTNWMERPFNEDGTRKPEPKCYAKRNEAKAVAEALVAEQQAKAAKVPANAGLWV